MAGSHFKDGAFPQDEPDYTNAPQPGSGDVFDEDYDQDAGAGYVQPYEMQGNAPQQPPAQPYGTPQQPYGAQPNPYGAQQQPNPYGVEDDPYADDVAADKPLGSTEIHAPLNPYTQARAKGKARTVGDPEAPADDRPEGEGSSRRRLFSNVLIAVGLALLLVAGGIWLYSQYRYAQQNEVNQQLASYVTLSDDPSQAPKVDWAGLKAINADIVGWLQIPGTQVNYPVYQGRDNDQYLRTTAEGEYSIGGQLFLDYQNTPPGMQDAQSIIYGHHLANGTMFKDVADMDVDDNFERCKTVWYVTEQTNYELEPLMLYYTDANDTNVRRFTFSGDDAFHSYLKDLKNKSKKTSGDVDVTLDRVNHVLSLITCNYYDGYGRTIFMCVPKAEANAARIAAGQVTK